MYSSEEIALSASTGAVQSVPHHNANNTISFANIIHRSYGSKDLSLKKSKKTSTNISHFVFIEHTEQAPLKHLLYYLRTRHALSLLL